MESKQNKSELTSFSQINNSLSNQNNNNTKQEREVEEIPPLLRRMDSFAWLIQGDCICAAAHFDGKKLALATNKTKEATQFEQIKNYLQTTASKARAFTSKISKLDQQGKDNEFRIFILQILQNIADLINKNNQHVYFLGDISYLKSFVRSLFKITLSIIDGCLDKESLTYIFTLSEEGSFKEEINKIANTLADKIIASEVYYRGKRRLYEVKEEMAEIVKSMFNDINDWFFPHIDSAEERSFSEDLINALIDKEGICYLEDNNRKITNNKTDLHAEIRILQKIIRDDQIIDARGAIQSEVVKNLPTQYVGISKRCCLNCEHAVLAVNEAIQEKFQRKEKLIDIRTFAGSGGKFRATIPDFLNESAEIRIKFLSSRGGKSLKEVFSQQDKSVSPQSQYQRFSKSEKGSKAEKKPVKSHRSKTTQRRKTVELSDEELKQYEGSNYENDLPIATLAQNLSNEVFIGSNSQPLDLLVGKPAYVTLPKSSNS